MSQWVLCPRLLRRATRPITHADNSLQWRAYVPLKIKSIEKSYRPECIHNDVSNQNPLLCCPFNSNDMSQVDLDQHVFECVCVSTCCTMVVNSRQSCTMLFFSNEYSVTLANGDLQQEKKEKNVS